MKKTKGGYPSGDTPVSELAPPPDGPGIGYRATSFDWLCDYVSALEKHLTPEQLDAAVKEANDA